MKYLILIAGLVSLTGCATKGVNATMFLKEDGSRLYNLKGKDCLESGYQVMKAPDGETYRLITYYSNCDVHKDRELKEFEIPHWIPEKKNARNR